MKNPIPISINLAKNKQTLTLVYSESESFQLSAEYLRVYSPSAEVVGHTPGQEILQVGKKNVAIVDLEPMGNYALKITFDDGHASGLYDWDYLYKLSHEYATMWSDYLIRLQIAGEKREAEQ